MHENSLQSRIQLSDLIQPKPGLSCTCCLRAGCSHKGTKMKRKYGWAGSARNIKIANALRDSEH